MNREEHIIQLNWIRIGAILLEELILKRKKGLSSKLGLSSKS
jgi:hypothetical protein